MRTENLEPELERRLAVIEAQDGLGADFDLMAWIALIALGVVLPAIVLLLGGLA
ncbi:MULTISPECIES: hypothetical protein [unclassified Mesorhizobium]|uniref:hypothetical protein n=1 Tax=unclassified Mesorhizobium TaxID=325217 RepID=UPI0004B77DAB|nr:MULTISPECIES: hypothetical protein [unclassified Mesorhizobium]